jgi:hypothetical protein
MRSALEDARVAAAINGKVPLVALVDRKGTRIQRWVCFPMEEFVADVLPILHDGKKDVGPYRPRSLTMDGVEYDLVPKDDKWKMDDPRVHQ